MLYRLFGSKVLDWALLLPEVQPLMPLELKIISLSQFPPFNSGQSRSKHKNIRTCWFALITQLKRYRVIALNKLNYGTKIKSHRKDREFVYSYGISWLIHETSYQYQLTLLLPLVIKTEFLLTLSVQYQEDKWWESRKMSVWGPLVDLIPNYPN